MPPPPPVVERAVSRQQLGNPRAAPGRRESPEARFRGVQQGGTVHLEQVPLHFSPMRRAADGGGHLAGPWWPANWSWPGPAGADQSHAQWIDAGILQSGRTVMLLHAEDRSKTGACESRIAHSALPAPAKRQAWKASSHAVPRVGHPRLTHTPYCVMMSRTAAERQTYCAAGTIET
jgi:hypothetical protein